MNGMRRFLIKLIYFTIVLLLVSPFEIVMANESDVSEGAISVILPTVREDEESPFDFFIDPQGLIFETKAAYYGGGDVEEGAYLLFHNRVGGEYLFSRNSDHLTITNQSGKSITITLRATIDGVEDVKMAQSNDFDDSNECAIYLALVDDEGNEIPLADGEETVLSVEMAGSSDTYSFGLTGDCNPNGNWEKVSIHPSVKITWNVGLSSSNDEEMYETEEGDNATWSGIDNSEEDIGEDGIGNEEDIFHVEGDETTEPKNEADGEDDDMIQDRQPIDEGDAISQNSEFLVQTN